MNHRRHQSAQPDGELQPLQRSLDNVDFPRINAALFNLTRVLRNDADVCIGIEPSGFRRVGGVVLHPGFVWERESPLKSSKCCPR